MDPQELQRKAELTKEVAEAKLQYSKKLEVIRQDQFNTIKTEFENFFAGTNFTFEKELKKITATQGAVVISVELDEPTNPDNKTIPIQFVIKNKKTRIEGISSISNSDPVSTSTKQLNEMELLEANLKYYKNFPTKEYEFQYFIRDKSLPKGPYEKFSDILKVIP